METAVKHRVSGAYRTVRAVVWKDGGEIFPASYPIISKKIEILKGFGDSLANARGLMKRKSVSKGFLEPHGVSVDTCHIHCGHAQYVTDGIDTANACLLGRITLDKNTN